MSDLDRDFILLDKVILLNLEIDDTEVLDEVKKYIGQTVTIINKKFMSDIVTIETKDESWFDVNIKDLKLLKY